MSALALLDLSAVFVFGLSGAFAASRAQLDIVGFVFLASLTALGGGTTRDVLLDRTVFWIDRPDYLATAAAAALLIYVTAHLVESRLAWLRWLDALALAVAVPAGLGVALDAGVSWPVMLLMGIATGTFGGLLRDVVVNSVPVVLAQGELYVTAAFAGGIAALAVLPLAGPGPALAAAGAVTLVLRAGSLAFGWALPVYRSRPPRR